MRNSKYKYARINFQAAHGVAADYDKWIVSRLLELF